MGVRIGRNNREIYRIGQVSAFVVSIISGDGLGGAADYVADVAAYASRGVLVDIDGRHPLHGRCVFLPR